jgi:hypothetical protein
MIIPVVPESVRCATCGDMATVVRSRSRQGEQLVLARIAGKLYITIDCQICGSRKYKRRRQHGKCDRKLHDSGARADQTTSLKRY